MSVQTLTTGDMLSIVIFDSCLAFTCLLPPLSNDPNTARDYEPSSIGLSSSTAQPSSISMNLVYEKGEAVAFELIIYLLE